MLQFSISHILIHVRLSLMFCSSLAYKSTTNNQIYNIKHRTNSEEHRNHNKFDKTSRHRQKPHCFSSIRPINLINSIWDWILKRRRMNNSGTHISRLVSINFGPVIGSILCCSSYRFFALILLGRPPLYSKQCVLWRRFRSLPSQLPLYSVGPS